MQMVTPPAVSIWSYEGRSSRSDYFVVLLITSVLGAISGEMMFKGGGFGFFSGLSFVVVLWVSMCACARRLHDVGLSGWWSLVVFVPVANIIFGLYALFAPGQEHENDFGLPTSKAISAPSLGEEVARTQRATVSSTTVTAEVVSQNLVSSEILNVEPMEDFWAQALHECESAVMKTGIWAKAFADAGGDDRVAKASYIRLRAGQLQTQYEQNQQALKLAREQELKVAEEKQKAQDIEVAELLAQMEEKELAQILLPHGRCPACEVLIPLSSAACPHCNALFGTDSKWKIKPLTRLDKTALMALRNTYGQSRTKDDQEGEAVRSLVFGAVIFLLILLIANNQS